MTNPFQPQLDLATPLTRERWEELNAKRPADLQHDESYIGQRIIYAMLYRQVDVTEDGGRRLKYEVVSLVESEVEEFLDQHDLSHVNGSMPIFKPKTA